MKSSEMTGCRQVFRFTLSQLFKQSSFVVTFVILCLVALLAFPIMAMNNAKEVHSAGSVEKVYVCNMAGFANFPIAEAEIPVLADTQLTVLQRNELDAYEQKFSESTEEAEEYASAVLVEIQLSFDTGYLVQTRYAADGKVEEEDAATVAAAIADWLNVYKVESVNAPEDVIQDITAPVNIEVVSYDDLVKEKPEGIEMSKYWIIYASLMILYMIIAITSSLVGNKISEEKTSKVVEYLLTNVRPMALVMGKVLASVVAALLEICCMFVVGFASSKVSAMVWGTDSLSALNGLNLGETLSGMNPGTVFMCIMAFVLGLLFYSLLAGLFGAAASKVEEVAQGYQTFTITLLIAFFLAMIALTMMTGQGMNLFVTIAAIFPLSSFLLLPGLLLSGELTVVFAVLAIVLQIVVTAILFWFVARVYESVIVASGKVLKLGDMIAMAKNANRKGAKNS